MRNHDLEMAIEQYDWESQEQREGYLSLVQHYRKFGMEPALPIDPVATFLIQKSHESAEYWREAMGAQISKLQDDIREVQGDLAEARDTIDLMNTTLKSQVMLLETLTRKQT